PVYPFANRWTEDDREDSYNAGLSLRQVFGQQVLDIGYSFVYTQGEIGYDYESLGAVAGTQQGLAGLIGNGFPGNYYRRQALEAGLSTGLGERWTARLSARYELGRFSDFHYLGFGNQLVYAHRAYTDVGPTRRYDAG